MKAKIKIMGECRRKSKYFSLPFECQREIFGSDHLTHKRIRKFCCKNKRIRLLAKPKHYTPKFLNENEIPNDKEIEVVHANEIELPTRIKLLAFPKVRKLIATRDAYQGGNVDKNRILKIENLASRSMLSMYSRLANVQFVSKPEKNKKWTKEDFARHCEWLKKRACPKPLRLPPKIKRKKVPLKKLLVSIYQLSIPRHPREKFLKHHGYKSVVKKSAMLYEPSDRINKLSVPRKIVIDDEFSEPLDPFVVNPSSLIYKPSRRIKELATPKNSPILDKEEEEEKELDELPSGVSKKALKAIITPRTIELSKPRPLIDVDDQETPNVNPKALKAKATPRILQLAKPREYPK